MAFPVSKQAKIEFELVDGISASPTSVCNSFFNHLANAEIDKLQKQDERVIFTSRNSLFRLSYKISVGFRINENLIVDYEIHLSELVKLCVVFAILIAFFSRMQFEYFVMLFVLAITSFYYLNVFIVENGLKNLLRDTFEKTGFSAVGDLESNQQTWMDDASRCPACGESITELDTKCPSCKLSLPARPISHKYYKHYQGETRETTIHYDYKEKKK